MGQGPSEAGEEGAGDYEREADEIEGGFASNHHNDADCHGGDDQDEFPRWGFESEYECKDEDEGEGGGLAHGEEGEGDEF